MDWFEMQAKVEKLHVFFKLKCPQYVRTQLDSLYFTNKSSVISNEGRAIRQKNQRERFKKQINM